MNGLLLALADKPEIDVSAHLDQATQLSLYAIALLVLFFMVRPELWKRLWFQRIDPRPAALMRIGYGMVLFWTFVDFVLPHPPLDVSMARFLFTDEGIWLTDQARKNYGGKLGTLWDPEHGFQYWHGIFVAMWDKFTILHFRSDPTFVFTIYGLMFTSVGLMIFGVWTRWTTILAWVLVESLYRYSPVFYTGGDTVTRVFLFLGMFARWGEAYSFDSWRRRRKAILGGAERFPALRQIPAWPLRLMMLQLAIIYCATGLLKSGATWANGTALYYSLNLDHFYRTPRQIPVVVFMQYIKVLPVMTVFVRWWEVIFPVVLLGVAINGYERDRRAGLWPRAAVWRRWLGYVLFFAAWAIGAYMAGLGAHYFIPDERLPVPRDQVIALFAGLAMAVPMLAVALYLSLRRMLPRVFDFVRHWIIGKRFWLVFGFGMHIGIDVGMNVGTFAEVMMAVYLAWLSGPEVEAFWRYVSSDPVAPGEGDRPIRKRKWQRIMLAPFDRLRFRQPGKVCTVLHHPDDASVRRAALLRCWDLGHRLEFEADEDVPPQRLQVRLPTGDVRGGRFAAAALARVMPGLYWLRPLRHIPGLGKPAGALALRILRQRA
jgi:hypothetical protein